MYFDNKFIDIVVVYFFSFMTDVIYCVGAYHFFFFVFVDNIFFSPNFYILNVFVLLHTFDTCLSLPIFSFWLYFHVPCFKETFDVECQNFKMRKWSIQNIYSYWIEWIRVSIWIDLCIMAIIVICVKNSYVFSKCWDSKRITKTQRLSQA